MNTGDKETDRVTIMEHAVNDLRARVKVLEEIAADINKIATKVGSIARWVKGSIGTVAAAAITSGLISGDFGNFLRIILIPE